MSPHLPTLLYHKHRSQHVLQPGKHTQHSEYIILVGNAKESPPTTCLPLVILVSYCLLKRTVFPWGCPAFLLLSLNVGSASVERQMPARSMGLVELDFSLRWYQSLGFYYVTGFHCRTIYLFLWILSLPPSTSKSLQLALHVCGFCLCRFNQMSLGLSWFVSVPNLCHLTN